MGKQKGEKQNKKESIQLVLACKMQVNTFTVCMCALYLKCVFGKMECTLTADYNSTNIIWLQVFLQAEGPIVR